jgi:hypothetical protein
MEEYWFGNVAITAETRPLSAATDSVTVFGTVTATAENFDIRPLSAATDSVMVYGTFTANTQFSGRVFTESNTTLSGVTDSAGIFIQDTSEQSIYSFYVFIPGSQYCNGSAPDQPSTTESYFVDDPGGIQGVSGGSKATLVCNKVLKVYPAVL